MDKTFPSTDGEVKMLCQYMKDGGTRSFMIKAHKGCFLWKQANIPTSSWKLLKYTPNHMKSSQDNFCKKWFFKTWE